MNNKFRIVVPSYNNEDWVDHNLKSIMNQTYTNYEVYYVDDCSIDGTMSKAKKIVGGDQRFTFIQNERNMGAIYNYVTYLVKNLKDDNTILCLLDGDDWLYDVTVLERINEFYNKHDVWMTYGGMIVYRDSGLIEANPQNSPYSDEVHRMKNYRKDSWRASHFRTHRAFLWKSILTDDMRELENKEYYDHASDLSFQFPCLEMCPKEKIGVVPFLTYVYNGTEKNVVRTAQRQMDARHSDVESEIRNRKKYKEGLGNGKYSQVNIIGYPPIIESDKFDVTFTHNLTRGEFDMSLITDFELPKYIKGETKIHNGKVIADLHESRFYSEEMNSIYEMVFDNYTLFDRILTYDEKLLTLPNAKLRLCMSTLFLTSGFHVTEQTRDSQNLIQIYPKTKNISCISSNKSFLEGHKKRLDIINHINSNERTVGKFDMFGHGFNYVDLKLDALKDYRFSITIENGYLKNMATEKLSDCFLTGTIPIYYGCPNLSDFFDMNGVLTFSNEMELSNLIENLSINGESEYQKRSDSIQRNFEIAREYALSPSGHFHKYLKDLISK